MTKLAIAFAAVVSLVGCGGKKQTADCDSALDNAMKISATEMKLDAAMTARIKATSLARCREDKWSGDALTCFAAAKTGGDLGTCEQKQSPEQRDKLKKALEAIAPEPTPIPTPGSAAPGGADAVGSGSGSAEAGSAAGSGSGSAGSGSAGSGSASAGSGSAGSGSAKP